MLPKSQEFIKALHQSLSDGSFVKLTLGNYQGTETELKKILTKKILIKREEKLSFTYQYKTRDIVKNYSLEEGLDKISAFLKKNFQASTLSTTNFQLQLDKNTLKKLDIISEAVSLHHDKDKKRPIDSKRSYLHDLKITDEKGEVYKNAQDKYRQINRYIEILEPLLKTLVTGKKIKVADMGSGKGYLTFALYDYMTDIMKLDVEVAGVEYRADMVDLCNKIAAKAGFSGLHFIQSGIEDFHQSDIDVLIALHACDTATDDAIYKGIKAGADLIIVAPCCHKQIRKEMEKSDKGNELNFLTKHGIFMERQAEMVTDGLRAEILQYSGYATKVFEFISAEHTAKNVMITAVTNKKDKVKDAKLLASIKKTKEYFGIQAHKLESLLGL